MQSPDCLWLPPPLSFNVWIYLYGIWAHLNGALHKSLPSVRVSVFVPLLSLLRNGSLNTFPQQQGIVGSIVFYEVRVVSKEIRRSVLPRNSCCFRGRQLIFVFHKARLTLSHFNTLDILTYYFFNTCFNIIFNSIVGSEAFWTYS
jgi:hypothetical protein